jgi:hypothetical protein
MPVYPGALTILVAGIVEEASQAGIIAVRPSRVIDVTFS